MNILLVQVFVSLLLVLGGVLLLAYSVKQGDHQHAERLSLLPLDDAPSDSAPAPNSVPAPVDEAHRRSPSHRLEGA